MSAEPPAHPRDGEAVEYVLGTLSAAERDAFERDMTADRALAALVRRWEEWLEPLAERTTAVPPSSSLWPRIAAATRGEGLRASAEVVAFPVADEVARLRRSRGVWRGATVAAASLAAALALWIAFEQRAAPAPTNGLVAVVNRSGDLPALIVRVNPQLGTVQVRTLATETPSGRALELWSIDGSGAPRSLGLVAPGTLRASIPADERGRLRGATLAVSVEPAGGSPTGAPTGPVVYQGRLVPETP